jgi:hypothetical protein
MRCNSIFGNWRWSLDIFIRNWNYNHSFFSFLKDKYHRNIWWSLMSGCLDFQKLCHVCGNIALVAQCLENTRLRHFTKYFCSNFLETWHYFETWHNFWNVT